MKSAARLTGSISTSAFRQRRSNSGLRQRAMLRPVQAFSFVGISHDANWAMNSWGSRPVNTVYVWRSAWKRAVEATLATGAATNNEAGADRSSRGQKTRCEAKTRREQCGRQQTGRASTHTKRG